MSNLVIVDPSRVQRCRAIRHDASPPAFGDTCFDVVVRLLRYANVLAKLLDRDALTDGVEIRYLLAESNGNCHPHIVKKPESKKSLDILSINFLDSESKKSMDSESKKSLDITRLG